MVVFSSENVSAVCPTDPVVTNNGESGAGKGNHLWNKLFHYYCLNKEQFLEHYYKRSNAETAFSMLKAKFGGGVRSRTAQINESLCKILAHNICVLIQSMAELNIKFGFWQENY